jgi:hypothetical protein
MVKQQKKIPKSVLKNVIKEYKDHDCCVINGAITIQPTFVDNRGYHSQLPLNGYRQTLDCSCGEYIEIFRNTCCRENVPKSANTKLSPWYYNTHHDYMKARCQTYDQKLFNLDLSSNGLTLSNCPELCNSDNCPKGWYKPNNPKFSTQGAVSSSTRINRLKYNTIASNGHYYPGFTYLQNNKQFPCKVPHKCN